MIKSVLVWAVLLFMPLELMAAKVKARIVDQDKKAIDKGQLKLVEKNSGKEYLAKTNKKGEAQFDKVDVGEYQLSSDTNGYMITKSDWVKVEEKETSIDMLLLSVEFYRKRETEGNAALSQGKFADAIAQYQEILTLAPKEGVIWSNLAKAYVAAREPKKAHEAAEKATSLDPAKYGNIEVQIKGWVSLEEGRLALENKEFPKAVQALTESLSVDPANADTHYALALAYGHQKKYMEALKSIDAALKLRPDDAGFLEVKKILNHNAEILAGK